jgi:hypothetical protein
MKSPNNGTELEITSKVGGLMHRLKSNMAAETKDFSEEGVLKSDKITIWGIRFEQQLSLFFFLKI